MKIQTLSFHPYDVSLKQGQRRCGVLIHCVGAHGREAWGDAVPLPGWSKETWEDVLEELQRKSSEILSIEWRREACFEQLTQLALLPSAAFGLESALLSLLNPLPAHSIPVSALFMGSVEDILAEAQLRRGEGYTSAKLKVGGLSFDEAAFVIQQLKDRFFLRIDVNRAWTTSESLQFFAQFPLGTFEYVEEPFQNPHDLAQFPHPLAVDESFPQHLSLEQLELLPTLKALIYKPTLQGGMLGCLPLHEWAVKRGIQLILSSSFESDVGLAHVASMAHRLSLSVPVGLGTYHYLRERLSKIPFCLKGPMALLPAQL